MKGILPVYLLMIVVDRGKAAKAARFLQEYSCPVQLILNGQMCIRDSHQYECNTDPYRRGLRYHFSV